jgi:hypothetical protein
MVGNPVRTRRHGAEPWGFDSSAFLQRVEPPQFPYLSLIAQPEPPIQILVCSFQSHPDTMA